MKARWVAAALCSVPIAGAAMLIGDWLFGREARRQHAAAIDNRYSAR